MLKEMKRLLFVALFTLNSIMAMTQTFSDPISAFVPLKETNWCNTGELTFYWTYCVLDEDDNGINDWTFIDAYINMGDGNIIYYNDTTFGPIIHQYSIMGQVEISGSANFEDEFGNITTSTIVWIDNTSANGDPCVLYNDPSETYSNSLTLDVYNINPLFSTTVTGGNVEFFNQSTYSPLAQNTSSWTYALFIDGTSVTTGSGFPSSTSAFYQTSLPPGQYQSELVYYYSATADDNRCEASYAQVVEVTVEDTCENCNSFKPVPGNRYWISAWVKEDVPQQVKTYDNAILEILFVGSAQPALQFATTGDIIDDWQRIVSSFTIPLGTNDIEISLVNNGNVAAYFDDIRIHPFNASMKSYVYDPETLWLTAELDDNNYATFYEYDKEGKLIRIKKETARGVMTIQESRSKTLKKEGL